MGVHHSDTNRNLQDYPLRCQAKSCTYTFPLPHLAYSRGNLARHLRTKHGIDLKSYSASDLEELKNALNMGGKGC